jgi:UPF0042 nucleotide-binding protein
MKKTRTVVVTGLSGSGRSAALKAFEDMGFYCVDNLPLVLLAEFVEFAQRAEDVPYSAIGIDIREKGFPERLPALYSSLKDGGRAIEMLFLDASDQTLVRRFSETRRPHPLARGTTPLIDGIRMERAALGEVKKLADRIIDTSDYTVHDLRQAVERHYSWGGAGRPMVVTIVTFGYKYGVPYDLDLMFDLRFLRGLGSILWKGLIPGSSCLDFLPFLSIFCPVIGARERAISRSGSGVLAGGIVLLRSPL